MAAINTIIFDLGGVLIDWNPQYVFHYKYFDGPETRVTPLRKEIISLLLSAL